MKKETSRKVEIMLFGIIFLNLFLFIPNAKADTTYTLGVDVGSQNTMRVTIVDDLLSDAKGEMYRYLLNEFNVGDIFDFKIISINETQEEICYYTLHGNIDYCKIYEYWIIKLNQYIYPFGFRDVEDRNSIVIFDDPWLLYNSLICALPVNEYLNSVKGTYSENNNTLTILGSVIYDSYFSPTEEYQYDSSTGWLISWRLKKEDIVIFEIVSDTYPKNTTISGYAIPLFLGFLMTITFSFMIKRRKKNN